MAKTTRQTAIFGIEDWRKIYQTYREADFQSYDFETLRKSFIDYIRLYYPENFNDYVESSEFIALLDVMAFMGQALSYRVDLNTRENFLDTAERRDSAVRLAQLVGYTAKRNQAAQGFLKVQSVQTTESVLDYNGIDLSNAVINWNDPTNPDWQEQFTAIINAGLVNSQRYGRPGGTSTILGVKTDEYTINLLLGYLPVVPFTATVDNNSMSFEVVSGTTQGEERVYEPAPRPNGQFNILYRNDGLGFGSPNTGFFFYFKQGSLQNQDFTLSERVSNRVVNLGVDGVNNEDVWLYQLDSQGVIQDLWTEVESIYNTATQTNISTNDRRIYSITSRANDAINLNFGDGVFSDVPVGLFRTYMRVSNGLNYVINPDDIQSVQVPIAYVSRNGRTETMTFTVSLTGAVSNAQGRETLDGIKQRAPARFYTQNRMVNGEDYNNFPFTQFGSIIKSKAVNRTSLGISRYLDLTDPTGKYSSTNVFGADGMLYRENNLPEFTFVWTDLNDITNVLVNEVEPILRQRSMLQFYYENFKPRPSVESIDMRWHFSTTSVNQTTGYFYTQIEDATAWSSSNSYLVADYVFVSSGNNAGYYQAKIAVPPGIDITNTTYWQSQNTVTGEKYQPIGSYASDNKRYMTVGSLIKFVAPSGQYFDANNRLQTGTPTAPNEKTSVWASIIEVILDGTNFGTGDLADGTGPVTINQFIPTGAIPTSVIPVFVTDLPASIEQEMTDQIELNRDFGIGYDYLTATWYLITSTNLAPGDTFSLVNAQNQSGTNLDASWLIRFTTDGEIYTTAARALDYYFASVLQTRFFYDGTRRIYDVTTGSVIDDFINVLKVNNRPQSTQPLGSDVRMDIIGQPIQSDGYVNDFVVTVSFTDSDGDGTADNPDFFNEVVGPDGTPPGSHMVFLQQTIDFDNLERYLPVNPGVVDATYATQDQIELVKNQYIEGDTFYAYDDNKFFTLVVTPTSRTLVQRSDYIMRTGRGDISFQYRHNSPNTRRIDPSNSNIIDLFIVTSSYYTAYQNYIKDSTGTVPMPAMPTIDELTNQYSTLKDFKMISDNLVINSVRFKPLFGIKAPFELQGTIKVVPQTNAVVSVSEIKSRVLAGINDYFSIDKWDFGLTFYFSEMAAYLHEQLGDIVSSVVLVPRDSSKSFGDLYEIRCEPDEIFVNAAGINDIEVITALNSTTLRTANV